jgi:hypothetical protein
MRRPSKASTVKVGIALYIEEVGAAPTAVPERRQSRHFGLAGGHSHLAS